MLRRALLVAAMLASCKDPVHDDAVAALGPEPAGSRPGPNHRAGQPCVVCHGGHGPGSPDFSVAGTIYTVVGSGQPASGAAITITDAFGSTFEAEANRAGNFYVLQRDWDPQYPLTVRVSLGSDHQDMTTTIGRDGSCNSCHQDPGDGSHMPGVYVRLQ